MSSNGKWVINSRENEIWLDPYGFETKEEAVAYGKKYYEYVNIDEETGEKWFFVGQKERYTPFVDVYAVIERIADNAYSEVGEVAEDYLEKLSEEEWSSLEEKLNNALHSWLNETGNHPNFYSIVNIERVRF
ncbi:hypothetical protein MHB73_21275 [Bacillus sp. FSL K6-6483]